jgi:hypothetical protein
LYSWATSESYACKVNLDDAMRLQRDWNNALGTTVLNFNMRLEQWILNFNMRLDRESSVDGGSPRDDTALEVHLEESRPACDVSSRSRSSSDGKGAEIYR